MKNEEKELTDFVNLQDVMIDVTLPLEERVHSFVDQVKDIYHYRVGDVMITSVFIGDENIQKIRE